MVVPPIQYGVSLLEIWGSPLCCLQEGTNLLYDHFCPESRLRSDKPLDRPHKGMGHVLVMVQLAAEGGVLANQLEIRLRHTLGSGCVVAWWEGRL